MFSLPSFPLTTVSTANKKQNFFIFLRKKKKSTSRNTIYIPVTEYKQWKENEKKCWSSPNAITSIYVIFFLRDKNKILLKVKSLKFPTRPMSFLFLPLKILTESKFQSNQVYLKPSCGRSGPRTRYKSPPSSSANTARISPQMGWFIPPKSQHF